MSNPNYYASDRPIRQESQYYAAPQQNYGAYSTYEPPRDHGNRHDMAVTRYDEERNGYDVDRRYSPSSRGRDGYYEDRPDDYEDREYSRDRKRSSSRPRSRGVREGEHKPKDHHKAKDVGATLIGGAVGAFAGHELGHNGIASTIGALAGAWGGHELEKRHEKKKERKEAEEGGYSRRSISRSRSRRRDDYEDDDVDDEPRRHHHHRRDSGRYD